MAGLEPLFIFQLGDGYSFRNLIAIVKNETNQATMIFSSKKIEISFMNYTKCAVHKIELDPSSFSFYQFNIKDQDGNIVDEYPISFDSNEMYNTTKGIGRKDGIRLYWLPGHNKINVQPMKGGNKDPGKACSLFVNISTEECMKYENPSHHSESNIKIQAKDFAEICSQASTLRCTFVEIIGRKSGAAFRSIRSDNSIACTTEFSPRNMLQISSETMPGDIDDLMGSFNASGKKNPKINVNITESEDLMTVKVPISTIKALSKIHNISPSGTLLNFYFMENTPTKIESKIGTYGIYTICLRNYSKDNDHINKSKAT